MRLALFRFLIAGTVFLLPFVVYQATSYPSIAFIDSGELAVVCQTLGIAHPTGYPLYTLLGRIFTFLPAGTTISKLVLFSGLSVSASILLLYLSLSSFSRLVLGESSDRFRFKLVLASLTLFFAFTLGVWTQATTNEVYGLHLLFLSVFFYLAFKWRESGNPRVLLLGVFVYGLAFGNHLSSILFLPALVALVLFDKNRRTGFRLTAAAAFLILLAATLYLFLPVRSSLSPLFDWSHPVNWHNFKNHVTGWQYQNWMFAGRAEDILKNLESFKTELLRNYPLPLLALGLFGVIVLFLRSKRVAIALFLLFITTLLYSVNYSIDDIANYFLPCYVAMWFCVVAGFLQLLRWAPSAMKLRTKELGAILLSLALAIFSLVSHYESQNHNKDFIAHDLVSNILASIPPGGVVLTDVWDYYSPYLYLRFVEGEKMDRILLDKSLLKRSWYYEFIRKAYPLLYRRCQQEFLEFQKAVLPFERNQPFEAGFIEEKYQSVLSSIVESKVDREGIYLVFATAEKAFTPYEPVPWGLSIRLSKETGYLPCQFDSLSVRGLEDAKVPKDDLTKFHLGVCALFLEARAKYETSWGQDAIAKRLIQKAGLVRSAMETGKSD